MKERLSFLTVALFLSVLVVPLAQADTLIPMTSATGSDYVDWSYLPSYPTLYGSFETVSNGGVDVTGDFIHQLNNYMSVLQRSGEPVLYASDAVEFTFDQGVSAVGAQLWTYWPYPSYFSATMSAFDSDGNSLGSTHILTPGSFIGLQDLTGANISTIHLSTSYDVWPNHWKDFELGTLSLQVPASDPSPVPEPSSLLLLGTGLATLAEGIRRKATPTNWFPRKH